MASPCTSEQVVAEPNRTMVVIRSMGLPAESASWSSDASEIDDYQPRLQLPDGSQLVSDNWALHLGGGTLEFPALPEEVYRVHLELPGLPLAPAGAAPEDWVIPIDAAAGHGRTGGRAILATVYPDGCQ